MTHLPMSSKNHVILDRRSRVPSGRALRACVRLSPVLLGVVALTGCASGGRNTAARSRSSDTGAATDEIARYVRALEPRPEVGGVGWLEARETQSDLSTQLALARLDVDVRPAGHFAAFEVDHRFHNDSEATLEGTFRFTLPPGAVVTGLAMEIGGELMEGEFVEKEKARRTYEQIVDSMRDPALLEWEQGKTFKLRVFPIEPQSDKRVVLRYLAPIHHDDQGRPEVVYPLAAPAMQGSIGEVSVRVDGHTVVSRRDVEPREVLSVPLPTGWGEARVLAQSTDEGRFYAVAVSPRWDALPAPAARPQRRRLVLVVDSSRSALEAWPLVQQSARTLLQGLAPDDEFGVVIGDLFARDVSGGIGPASTARIDAVAKTMATLEPDGASDLGAAIDAAARMIRNAGESEPVRTQVVYLGDGTATWGEIDDAALRERVATQLANAEVHALAMGRGPREAFLRDLSGGRGGAAIEPSSVTQVSAFGEFLARASQIRRLENVRIETPAGAEAVLPAGGTWFEGQSPIVYVRSTASSQELAQLTIHGEVDGREVAQRFELARSEPGDHVDQLWAAGKLAANATATGDDALDDEAVVEMSRRYGVLSRKTSLLVLESEEAYERYQIERANQQRTLAANTASDPTVSGRDLETLGGDGNSLTPGDLQPGDPEIEIPAPEDASSVIAVFPFGETKAARWDPARGAWTLRFLVADDTPAGTYDVQIRITHADGHVALTKATYTIDMSAPTVDVVVLATDEPGVYRVVATQVLHEDDAARERPEGMATSDEIASTLDAKRVRVLMPDGQTLILRRGRAGAFERRWTPKGAVRWPLAIELSVTDRALNTQLQTVQVEGVGQ